MQGASKILIFIHQYPRKARRQKIQQRGFFAQESQSRFDDPFKVDQPLRTKMVTIDFERLSVVISKPRSVLPAGYPASQFCNPWLQVPEWDVRSNLVGGIS